MMSAEPASTVPADGNVFDALGFDSEEAARLLAEANVRIAAAQ